MEVSGKKKKNNANFIKIIGGLAGLLIILLAIFLLILRPEFLDLKGAGYIGAFVISVLGGSTIVVPIPAMAVIFALGGLLKYPIIVGIAAGIGETVGEMAGYMAGWSGSGQLKKRNFKFYSRLEQWTKKHGVLGLFILSAFPNPFFLFTAATAGALRYSLWKFLLSTGAGKTIKGIMVAYAGAFGLNIILKIWPG